jgi:hypothetical protein
MQYVKIHLITKKEVSDSNHTHTCSLSLSAPHPPLLKKVNTKKKLSGWLFHNSQYNRKWETKSATSFINPGKWKFPSCHK